MLPARSLSRGVDAGGACIKQQTTACESANLNL